ncbi:MAG: hypothetical protein K6A33_01990 [Clostridiales bacterium]|nr:hypothetical protein [Clostridiales bacterium]
MNEGYFDGSMPRAVLEYYLSRAATAQWIYLSDTLDDDIRVILKAGIKFLGRASGIWKAEMPDEEHFALSRAAAEKIHAADPEIILQACIFEAVYREDLESTKIPAQVFEAFGMEPEDRCFSYDACTLIPGGNMPDISRTETQLWFYYRGISYIDCGYEAFHMGQIHLYSARDRGYRAIGRVIGMLREYGRLHARRHKVLFDAHSHSLVVNGVSLLDYNAMPFTRYPVLDRPGERLVLVREGKSGGGISPEGVYEKALPFLYEYDNWGGKDHWAHAYLTTEERAWAQWWGYDQIAWFASQEEKARNTFLDYTFKWTAVNNPDGYFAFPLRRPLQSGEEAEGFPFYKLNNRSEACPDGFSQEATAAGLLRGGYEKYRALANPSDLLDYGGRDVDDPETGVRLPEKVVLYGSFQPYVGAVENDSNSEITRMYYVGDGKYALAFVMPYAGEYDFGISTWGTLSACVSEHGGYPYSGTGNKSKLEVPHDNTVIRITFTYMTNAITIDVM